MMEHADVMVWTIGHSTRPMVEFLGILDAHEIRGVVDIRRYPGSRRHPHFSREAMERALGEAGLVYRHEPDLGGRRTPAPDSPNTGLRNEQFRGYADYALTPSFEEAVLRLIGEARSRRTTVMCAEAVPWRCHRSLLADHLVVRGVVVNHIMSEEKEMPHTLNKLARVGPGGLLIYAADVQMEFK